MAHEVISTAIGEEPPYIQPTKRPLPRWIPKRWYVHIFLWISCIVIGFPLFYALIVSTQSNSEVYNHQFVPGQSLADNWTVVMVNRNLGNYMVNSIFVALAVTFGKTVLSLLAGLAFVYFRFPGKWLVFGFVLITLMMPTEILLYNSSDIICQFHCHCIVPSHL